MMDFFISYFKKLISWIIIIICSLFFNLLQAGTVGNVIKSFQVETYNGNLYAYIDSNINLNNNLKHAINKGLPVTFTLKAKILKKRWYWLDTSINELEYKWLITYRPFINKYKLSSNYGLSLYFDNLHEAISIVQSLKKWLILESYQIKNKQEKIPYTVMLKFYLDKDKLPRLVQLQAINNDELSLDSGWHQYIITP